MKKSKKLDSFCNKCQSVAVTNDKIKKSFEYICYLENIINRSNQLPFYNFEDLYQEEEVGEFNNKKVFKQTILYVGSEQYVQKGYIDVLDLYKTKLKQVSFEIKRVHTIDIVFKSEEGLDDGDYAKAEKEFKEYVASSKDIKKYKQKVDCDIISINNKIADLKEDIKEKEEEILKIEDDIKNDPDATPKDIQDALDAIAQIELEIQEILGVIERVEQTIERLTNTLEIVTKELQQILDNTLDGYKLYHEILLSRDVLRSFNDTLYVEESKNYISTIVASCDNNPFEEVKVGLKTLNEDIGGRIREDKVLVFIEMLYIKDGIPKCQSEK